ncbi:hypothetical protein QCA50_006299 [Cerrena zonata]|uniref:HTH APSES-type domain-containing protein n=1 Tax=Cerrena zonata TaxID=2478898 RepID=A0AAW0GEL7_9APHY
MSSSMIIDPIPSPTSENGSGSPRYRPFASPNHHVTKGRYITSNDPRGYIPVYEYPLNGQWIMLDMDDGYVLWTGIWKALGNSKADIVKMIESQPDLAPKLRRVRGGYLKIQGTWMPYEIALKLARRVAWPIRYELIPLFGPTFPDTCLSPDQPGFGQIVKPGTGKRRRRHLQPTNVQASLTDSQHDWPLPSASHHGMGSALHAKYPPSAFHPPPQLYGSTAYPPRKYSMSDDTQDDSAESIMLHNPYGEQSANSNWRPGTGSTSASSSGVSPISPPALGSGYGASARYSPYPNPLQHHRMRANSQVHQSPASSNTPLGISAPLFQPGLNPERIVLPALGPRSPPSCRSQASPLERESLSSVSEHAGKGKLTLPPISALDERRASGFCDDSSAVLKRLRSTKDDILLPDVQSTVGSTPNPRGTSTSLSTAVNSRRLSAPSISQSYENHARWDGPQSASTGPSSASSGPRAMLPPLNASSSAPSTARPISASSSTSPRPSNSSYPHPSYDQSPDRISPTSPHPPQRRPPSSSIIDDVRGKFSRLYENDQPDEHHPRTGYQTHDPPARSSPQYDHHHQYRPSGQPSRYDGNERLVDPTRQTWRPW